MVCNPNRADADFYYLRRPQPSWHHGEAIITTNDWTDGTFTPADEDFGADAYYNDESPKTQESHWDLLASSGGSWNYQMLSVAYRGRENMTIWADGRLDGTSRTPRLEYEWSELFHTQIKYSGGTGEPNDPYRIATAADLIALGESPEDYDKHFILTADIDLDPNLPGRKVFDRAVIAPDVNDAPSPGYTVFDGAPFSGVFDGNDHTISHLMIMGDNYLGLFGQTYGATISGLGLEAVDVNGTGECVGGLVGDSWDGSITSSYSKGSVRGDEGVGGLVGYNDGSIITCYSSAAVSGGQDVGGLVEINEGSITTSYSTGSVTGDDEVGGLLGYNVLGSIFKSHSTGTVNGDSNVGGLVGSNEYHSAITACYSTGTVSGGKCVGGLAGRNTANVSNCYSSGTVGGGENAGGLVGDNRGSITMSYSTGRVSGDESVGGLVGDSFSGDAVVTANYWDIETSNEPNMCGVDRWGNCDNSYGRTTAEMKQQSTFEDWDFINVWGVGENQTYPYLRKYSAADIDQDGNVNFGDLAILVENWLGHIVP